MQDTYLSLTIRERVVYSIGSLRNWTTQHLCPTLPLLCGMCFNDEVNNESLVPTNCFFVCIRLNGGPGCSSMTGCFEENIGPFDLHNNQTLTFNNFTWIQDTHVLFIDQPLGTGWSFAQNDSSYATNEQQVSLDLYNGLIAFFNLHPQYNNCDLYITGESYAGK